MQNTQQLTVDELEPADVLLARGHGIVSDLIMKADGGNYSHAALWSGTGVIQATSAGITHLPPAEGDAFDVYRRRGLDAAGATEVVAVAKRQVNGSYAYGELVLLGLLFSAGVRVKGALLNRILQQIGGVAATRLKQWLDEHAQNKKIRVCTELVASSYYYAAGQRVALRIRPFDKRPAAASSASRGSGAAAAAATGGVDGSQTEADGEQIAAATARCLELLQDRATRKLLSDPIALDDDTSGEIGVVTPADLQFSPSLEFRGHFRA